MSPKNQLTVAIDFDGTIVENAYPQIGKTILFAFETMKKLESEGHRLILWTYREGVKLEEAVDFCLKNGVEFYAINKSYPEELLDDSMSRKINADIFIDDRNIGGLLSWTKTYELIFNYSPELPKKKNFFSSFR
jgi:hypothetical protein